MHQRFGLRTTGFVPPAIWYANSEASFFKPIDFLVRALISKLKNTKMEGRIMSDEKEKHDECRMDQTDSEGNTNLCCCYIVDPDGQYEDPCFMPVDDCCC